MNSCLRKVLASLDVGLSFVWERLFVAVIGSFMVELLLIELVLLLMERVFVVAFLLILGVVVGLLHLLRHVTQIGFILFSVLLRLVRSLPLFVFLSLKIVVELVELVVSVSILEVAVISAVVWLPFEVVELLRIAVAWTKIVVLASSAVILLSIFERLLRFLFVAVLFFHLTFGLTFFPP